MTGHPRAAKHVCIEWELLQEIYRTLDLHVPNSSVLDKLEDFMRDQDNDPVKFAYIPPPEPSIEDKLWVVSQIAKFIHDTKAEGSFRQLIYEYLDLCYQEAYLAGGMVITNSLSGNNYREYVTYEKIQEEKTDWHIVQFKEGGDGQTEK